MSYALFDFPSAVVSVSDGNVNVILKVPESQCDAIKTRVEDQLSEIKGISKYTVQIDPYY